MVIGANFGDEGKGLMTDYFVSKFNGDCFVVRFNGGAQAGHTVVTPDGERHKFSHFGSGSFWGAPTYLSKFFIVNPLLFMDELSEFDFDPVVYIDENCLVSTPYDMYLNQLTEKLRGDKRHGSCGVGINETIERSNEEEYFLKIKDLRYDKIWKEKFKRIAQEYYPQRLKQLGNMANPIFNDDLFVDIFKEFKNKFFECDHEVLNGQNLVFEGAQGLLLDQNHINFPYVTRSNTGFQNVKEILEDINREDDDTEVVYVTRSYLTRHGRGPFPTEIEGLPYGNVVDHTNLFNEFQEHLRFGILDVDDLVETINKDISKNNIERRSIAVTCLDQVDRELIKFYEDGIFCESSIPYFVDDLRFGIDGYKIYQSYGRTKETI